MESEFKMKVVGRKNKKRPTLQETNILLHTTKQLLGSIGVCEKGVYRFKTFEESDKWMMEQTVKMALVRRHLKI